MSKLSFRIAHPPTPAEPDALAPARGVCWGLLLSCAAWAALIGAML